MIIEQLSFTVRRECLDDWLTTDAAVWDPVLASLPGYLGKEVWITEPDGCQADTVDVHVIVRWTDRATWKSIDQQLLATTHAAMGEHALELRETVHLTSDDPALGRSGSGDASA